MSKNGHGRQCEQVRLANFGAFDHLPGSLSLSLSLSRHHPLCFWCSVCLDFVFFVKYYRFMVLKGTHRT